MNVVSYVSALKQTLQALVKFIGTQMFMDWRKLSQLAIFTKFFLFWIQYLIDGGKSYKLWKKQDG